jgi:hypothetical protein
MAAMAKLPLTPPTEMGRRSRRPFTFVSTCTACGQERMQNFYTGRGLLRLIEKGQVIDAYCPTCNAVWAINSQERVVMARAITAAQISADGDAAFES